MPTPTKNRTTMQDIVDQLNNSLIPIKEGKMIEVTILAKSKNKILVDVSGYNLGFIPEKEFSNDVNDLAMNDNVLAYVLSAENSDGYTVLSLKRADRERFASSIKQKFDSQEAITVRIKQANKGGLIAEYGSMEGFLPASQLASNHYPKVGENKEQILSKLNELISQNLKVKIINYEENPPKLIFSEKAAGDGALEEKMKTLQVGQQFEGRITGIVDFGIFVDIGNVEGLVHISEISWDKVSNLREMFKVGQLVKVQIISIENNKVSFSIKRLSKDPWLDAIKDLEVGQNVSGKVIKITPFGLFIELANNLKGLIHISELATLINESKTSKIEDLLPLNSIQQFYIASIDINNHKINLTLTSPKTDSEVQSAKESSSKEKGKSTIKTKTKKSS